MKSNHFCTDYSALLFEMDFWIGGAGIVSSTLTWLFANIADAVGLRQSANGSRQGNGLAGGISRGLYVLANTFCCKICSAKWCYQEVTVQPNFSNEEVTMLVLWFAFVILKQNSTIWEPRLNCISHYFLPCKWHSKMTFKTKWGGCGWEFVLDMEL